MHGKGLWFDGDLLAVLANTLRTGALQLIYFFLLGGRGGGRDEIIPRTLIKVVVAVVVGFSRTG